ncbi:MAG TPA: YscO family type III secretion system apparatus protein [Ramlibacter sp.]|jgi:type III secretion protein O|nr:YscO family type III secretion system apparatus protein [Ramlibacter sp.]
MDVIDGLLRIKRVREESREAELRRARQHLETAAEALRKAKQSQQERDQERTDRERSLYDEVCAKTVVVRELDDLKWKIEVMKDEAKADAQAVVDAQTQRQKRRDTFDEATSAWQLAAQAKQRFEDLAAERAEARAKHAEWLAELELEEHPARSPLTDAMEEA